MSYELTGLIQRCNREDAKLIIATIDSYINFTDDKGLKKMLEQWTMGTMPISLAQKIEKELRYLGSSDLAYFTRKMRGLEPAGVPVEEMLNDISKVLGVKNKKIGTLESKLEHLACSLVEKTIFKLKPEEQVKLLKGLDISDEVIKKIQEYTKEKGSKLLIPVLIQILGPKLAVEMIEAVVTAVMAQFLGKEAIKQVMKELAKRCPWLIGAGPIIAPLLSAALSGWLVVDLCGPAMRKTIPLLLHLSVVALRDGVDESVWSE